MRPASPPHSQPHRFPPNSHSINTIHSPVRSYVEPDRSHPSFIEPVTTHMEASKPTTVVPKYIESGYIVGPPIAYTNQPNLPPNYAPFSPSQSQFTPSRSQFTPTQSQVMAQSSSINGSIHPRPPVHLTSSQLKESTPSIVVHAPTRDGHSQQAELEKCMNECRNWQTKYNQLYLKHMNQNQDTHIIEQNNTLRRRIRQLQDQARQRDHLNIKLRQLIEKYKESTLKETYLLLDRYRLESKQRQSL